MLLTVFAEQKWAINFEVRYCLFYIVAPITFYSIEYIVPVYKIWEVLLWVLVIAVSGAKALVVAERLSSLLFYSCSSFVVEMIARRLAK